MVFTPFISVIIAVRNGEKYIGDAIRSIISQQYEPIEIIVVDGKSEDSTVSIASSYRDVRVISQTHLSLADARNIGVDSARGNLIAFLDSDDIWAPRKLATQVRYLQEHTEIIAVIALLSFFRDSGHKIDSRYIDRFEREWVGYTPGTLVVRKEDFLDIGYFYPTYSIGCDTDWFARVLDANIPLAIIPKVLLYKRVHDRNLSLNSKVCRNEVFSILRESLDRKREKSDHG